MTLEHVYKVIYEWRYTLWSMEVGKWGLPRRDATRLPADLVVHLR